MPNFREAFTSFEQLFNKKNDPEEERESASSYKETRREGWTEGTIEHWQMPKGAEVLNTTKKSLNSIRKSYETKSYWISGPVRKQNWRAN